MSLLSAGTSLSIGLALSGIDGRWLWPEYAAAGGRLTSDELRAYLTGAMFWPDIEYDLAADILNQHCVRLGLSAPVAFAHEQGRHDSTDQSVTTKQITAGPAPHCECP